MLTLKRLVAWVLKVLQASVPGGCKRFLGIIKPGAEVIVELSIVRLGNLVAFACPST